MRRDRVRRLGIVGVMLGLVCLGVAGERAAVLDDSQLMKRQARVEPLAAGFFRRRPAVTIPILHGVRWTDAGPAGVSLEVQAEAVSRRPRRVGLLTFLSFQEIVATKVRVRVAHQRHGADRDRGANSASEAFNQLQGTLAGLQAMVREGLDSGPDPAHFFTRTFLSGAVFESFVVEVARDGGVGRLRSRTMTTAPGGPGWILQGVQVEATDGRRLTIYEATWTSHGRLVAHGAYALEENRERAAGPRGCFLVRLSDAVEFRRLVPGDADAALCAPNPLVLQGPPGLPALAMPFPEAGGAAVSVQAIPLLQVLPFLPLPAIPLPAHGGHRADRLKQWLLPSLTPGLSPSATGRAWEGPDSPE